MEDVADASGITRLIVYRNFASKEDLYRAVLERVVTRLGEEFTDAESAVRPLLTVAREDPDAFRLLWAHAAHEPRFAAYVADFREAAVEFADELVGSRIADTRLRRWAMIVIVDHLYDAVLTWLDVGDPKRDDEFVSVTSSGLRALDHGLGRAAMTAGAHRVRRARPLPRERGRVRHPVGGAAGRRAHRDRGRPRIGTRGERAPVGRRRRPRSCSCTAARRTRTRGTPSRSRSVGPRWPSTCPVTATRDGATTSPTHLSRTPRTSRSRSSTSPRTRQWSSACRSGGSPRSLSPRDVPTWCAG